MKSLLYTNPYLNDPIARERMLLRSVYESSVFSRARHLKFADLVKFARLHTLSRKKKKR
jgi:hypothetical protein